MSGTIRIYVNNKAIDVPRDATLIDAITRFDSAEADLVRLGQMQVNDSRGLPTAPGSSVYDGAIFRLVRARAGPADPPDPEPE